MGWPLIFPGWPHPTTSHLEFDTPDLGSSSDITSDMLFCGVQIMGIEPTDFHTLDDSVSFGTQFLQEGIYGSSHNSISSLPSS